MVVLSLALPAELVAVTVKRFAPTIKAAEKVTVCVAALKLKGSI